MFNEKTGWYDSSFPVSMGLPQRRECQSILQSTWRQDKKQQMQTDQGAKHHLVLHP